MNLYILIEKIVKSMKIFFNNSNAVGRRSKVVFTTSTSDFASIAR